MNLLNKLLRAFEPWYDWGVAHVSRMEGSDDVREGGEGPVRYFDLQWLGLHVSLQVGRTPPRFPR